MADPPPAESLIPGVQPEQFPRHIAVIMDGNGRWARQRHLPRIQGHRRGVKSVRAVTEECVRLGLDQLTLYGFSVENWRRPRPETDYLMRLYRQFLVQERKTILENNVRFRMIGREAGLPEFVRRELAITTKASERNTGLVLCLAINYGARTEIADAARQAAAEAAAGRLDPASLDEDRFSRFLYTAGMPDPDLLIRTAGEMRVSNFLLWQISYAEFYVTPVLWPDFGREDLWEAIRAYAGRERRFGGLKEAYDQGTEPAGDARGGGRRVG
jgi:undecaprenyl diphosphate synthase